MTLDPRPHHTGCFGAFTDKVAGRLGLPPGHLQQHIFRPAVVWSTVALGANAQGDDDGVKTFRFNTLQDKFFVPASCRIACTVTKHAALATRKAIRPTFINDTFVQLQVQVDDQPYFGRVSGVKKATVNQQAKQMLACLGPPDTVTDLMGAAQKASDKHRGAFPYPSMRRGEHGGAVISCWLQDPLLTIGADFASAAEGPNGNPPTYTAAPATSPSFKINVPLYACCDNNLFNTNQVIPLAKGLVFETTKSALQACILANVHNAVLIDANTDFTLSDIVITFTTHDAANGDVLAQILAVLREEPYTFPITSITASTSDLAAGATSYSVAHTTPDKSNIRAAMVYHIANDKPSAGDVPLQTRSWYRGNTIASVKVGPFGYDFAERVEPPRLKAQTDYQKYSLYRTLFPDASTALSQDEFIKTHVLVFPVGLAAENTTASASRDYAVTRGAGSFSLFFRSFVLVNLCIKIFKKAGKSKYFFSVLVIFICVFYRLVSHFIILCWNLNSNLVSYYTMSGWNLNSKLISYYTM